nr:MAG TPA: hypothetical protein [Caudoviricetes sp.]
MECLDLILLYYFFCNLLRLFKQPIHYNKKAAE